MRCKTIPNILSGPNLAKGDFFGQVSPVWSSKLWGIGRRAGRYVPIGAPSGQKVCTNAYCEVLPAPESPHANPQTSGVIGPKCVVKHGPRTFAACFSTVGVAAQ